MRQLFVEELKKVEGGAKPQSNNTEAMRRTTLACCEENGICCF